MSGYPWLTSTTSGGLLDDSASLSVVLRLAKSRTVRFTVTLGYFASKALLSDVTTGLVPSPFSASHTVSVTSPAFATSVETSDADFADGASELEPGAHPVRATSPVTVSAARDHVGGRKRAVMGEIP